MTAEIELDGGMVVRTGCLVPPSRPASFPVFSERLPVLNREQIENVIFDPDRVPARIRFDRSWIGNQGPKSSCNGYAGAKMLQRARVRRGLPRVNLSGEGLYAQINGGRDEGSMLDDGMKCLMEHGVPAEDLVPHGLYQISRMSREALDSRARFRGYECYRIESEMELVTALCIGFDCVVAVHVTNNFVVNGDGFIGRSQGPGNHAVGVDDVILQNGQFAFDNPGSWGAEWGDQGRGYLTWRGHLESTHQNHCFYAIRSTSDDPLADSTERPPVAYA